MANEGGWANGWDEKDWGAGCGRTRQARCAAARCADDSSAIEWCNQDPHRWKQEILRHHGGAEKTGRGSAGPSPPAGWKGGGGAENTSAWKWNPNQIIIDARPEKAYEGKVSAAKRFGHIPEAQNFPASHNINYEDKTQKLQTISKLKEIYKNVDKSKKIVLYCAIGRIAATNYFALRELDYDVSNYDASWKEWGNDSSLPITNPSKD